MKFEKQFQQAISKAKRNLGFIMRYSRTFLRAETLKTFYIALVRSHLDYASAVWGLLNTEQSESIERIQKRFLRYLYYKDFVYYEWSITYNELVLGYGLTKLKVRKDPIKNNWSQITF